MAKSKNPNGDKLQKKDNKTIENPVELPMVHYLVEALQKEIPMVHNLNEAFQKEIPMVHNLYEIIPSLQKTQAFLDCYINALVKYNLACAVAARNFAADIARCNRKRVISTQARPRKRKRR